ncbi:restriction endonuclease subunit S [Eubacteriaceae bacterium ES3]|nr:restriction endonuclease subunit S [Eubacteriaceae bacterium ES3]
MSEEKKMVPQLRFPGFTDPWESRKLENLMDFSNGINAPKENYGKGRKMISVMDVLSFGELSYENIRNSVEVDSTVEERYKVENGDIVFARSSEIPEEVGWAKAYTDNKYALYSGFAIRGKKKSEYDSIFIERSLNGVGRKQIERKAGGSTRFNVSQGILNSIDIIMPNYKEQTQIGSFLKQLDNLIILHQRKLGHLQTRKKGLLQKMFPKAGNSVPELRFPGFTDAWEQRKLNEISEIIGGGTPSTNSPEYWDGDIDWYSPAEINDQIYVGGSERKITKLGLEKSSAKILPANKTVLFTSRAGIGKTAILRHPGTTNQGFQSMVLNDVINTYFVYSMSDMIKMKAAKVASGSTFAEISGKMLGNLDFMFPSKNEQDKIGDYFSKLDNLITLQQRKLEHLQARKKALLQQMFV